MQSKLNNGQIDYLLPRLWKRFLAKQLIKRQRCAMKDRKIKHLKELLAMHKNPKTSLSE